jgi:hypothetical protein
MTLSVVEADRSAGRVSRGGWRGSVLLRRAIVGTVLIGFAFQFGGPAAQGTPRRYLLRSGQAEVECPILRRDPPDTGASAPPLTGAGWQMEVTIPPLVFITVGSRVLRVSTNTGRPPVASDGFYVIRRDRARRAPVRVVESVLRSCH